MCNVEIIAPEELLLLLHMEKNDFEDYARKVLALDLYSTKKISLRCCADVAKMTIGEFIKYLGENEISVFSFETEYEFKEEVTKA